MKKDRVLNILQTILLIFLMIQPIFDLKIFYNSISTLIRVTIIGILFVIYFILDNNKKKCFFLLYFGLLIVYFFFHHMNALNFNSLVPGNFDYNVVKELLYIIKMITPFLLIYLIQKMNIPHDKIKFIMKTIVYVMSAIIIISNIFVFSYGSYSDEIIKDNFFSWFTDGYIKYSYYELASKGLFEFANQIGAVLIMFLPFVLYYTIKDKKMSDIVTLIINVFALILLGTKTSVLGIFIVFVAIIFFSITFNIFIKKENINFNQYVIPLIIFVMCLVIFPFTPIFSRRNVTNQIIQSSNIIRFSNNDIDIKLKYIEENYENKRIHKQFILDSYPYKYDPDFWVEMLNEDISKRIDYRYLETSIIKRIIEINNNDYDRILGITNTRLQNAFNIERDFIVQYYSMGIIGVILLLGPYITILIKSIYKFYKQNKINLLNIISIFTIIFIICISIYSGNLFNSLSFTIYFSILYYFMGEDCKYNDKFLD